MSRILQSGWFAIAMLVVFLGCMSQGLISVTKVTLEDGLDPATRAALWKRFAAFAVGAALTGGILVRGIITPTEGTSPDA